ncbi:helix-turn-helix domain-containing protein [Kitasatospora sp. NPDC093806]|uniref:helix-turn-helix transcriptional regulator n=1 Tax=Kitasatospora sp. NPDC093806 TaxID=3155075 RepID=UPI003424C0BA
MPDPTAAELPDAAARAMYRAILRDGGRVRAADVQDEDAAALQTLIELGLLKRYASDGFFSAVDPRAVSARMSADLRSAGTRLLTRAEELPELLGDLTDAYDSSPRRFDRGGSTTIVEGMEEIRHLVSQLAEEMPHEVLSAQPGGARPTEAMDDIVDHSRHYIERGGAMRTLYEATALLDGPTVELAARLSEVGNTPRVLPFGFTRMIIFERTVAVIPASPDTSSAAFVEDPPTVAFLVALFEQHWQIAERVNWAGLAAGAAESRTPSQVGRLLAQGFTQRAIATRLGLSERTVAGHIARLRELYDAETLFQLGWQMRGEPRA